MTMINLRTSGSAVINRKAATRIFISVLCISMVMTMLSGCGVLRSIGVLPSTPTLEIPEPVVPLSQQSIEVALAISTAEDINPDVNSRPSPVMVRLFLSESGTDLESRSIDEIFELDGAEMSPSPRATAVLRPGTETLITLKGVKTESQLSIAVAYREFYITRWITTKQLDTSKPIRIGARITRINVTFDVDD